MDILGGLGSKKEELLGFMLVGVLFRLVLTNWWSLFITGSMKAIFAEEDCKKRR